MQRLIIALVVLSVILNSMISYAQSFIPYVGQIQYAAPDEAVILILPDGSGPPLTEARNAAGEVMDATIRVQLVDIYMNPVPMFPGEDLWLQFLVDPGTVTGCISASPYPGGIFPADSPTSPDGWTTFSLPLFGGGWSTGPVWVYLNGNPAYTPTGAVFPPLPLSANSPDLNGDRQVNLADVSLFATVFHGEYHLSGDLLYDGAVNLADVTVLAEGIGANCP